MKEKERVPLFVALVLIFTAIGIPWAEPLSIVTVLPALIVGVVYAGIVFFIINLLSRKKVKK